MVHNFLFCTICALKVNNRNCHSKYHWSISVHYMVLQDGGKQLQEGMEENKTILEMDLRLTECGQESEYCINQILHRNREAARNAIIQQKQVHAPPQKNYIEPQAAHRYKAAPQQV